MAQLKRGGKETLDALLSDLVWIDHHAADNPAAVRKLTQRIRDRIEQEVKPYLLRAEPTIEARLKAVEEAVQALEAERAGVIRLKREA